MTINILNFDTTREAYDACQCDEDINDGDVLVVLPEGVIGIAGTWPLAVTVAHGALHPPAVGVTVAKVLAHSFTDENPSVDLAKKIAAEHGFAVRK